MVDLVFYTVFCSRIDGTGTFEFEKKNNSEEYIKNKILIIHTHTHIKKNKHNSGYNDYKL